MKRLVLVTALGLAVALSVGAQTTTSDEKQDATQSQTKTNVEQNTGTTQERVKTHRAPAEKEREKSRMNENVNGNVNERENTRVRGHGNAEVNERTTSATGHGGVTVWRNGRETTENLNLRRMTRDRTDVHFSIGTHPRDWWLRTYSIVVMDGCHYYLADNGCWYPAYGFDPSCDYTQGVVYCQ